MKELKNQTEKSPGFGRAEMAVLRVLALAGGYLTVNAVRPLVLLKEREEASRELIRRALTVLHSGEYLARRDEKIDNRPTSFYALTPRGRMSLGESV